MEFRLVLFCRKHSGCRLNPAVTLSVSNPLSFNCPIASVYLAFVAGVYLLIFDNLWIFLEIGKSVGIDGSVHHNHIVISK